MLVYRHTGTLPRVAGVAWIVILAPHVRAQGVSCSAAGATQRIANPDHWQRSAFGNRWAADISVEIPLPALSAFGCLSGPGCRTCLPLVPGCRYSLRSGAANDGARTQVRAPTVFTRSRGRPAPRSRDPLCRSRTGTGRRAASLSLPRRIIVADITCCAREIYREPRHSACRALPASVPPAALTTGPVR